MKILEFHREMDQMDQMQKMSNESVLPCLRLPCESRIISCWDSVTGPNSRQRAAGLPESSTSHAAEALLGINFGLVADFTTDRSIRSYMTLFYCWLLSLCRSFHWYKYTPAQRGLVLRGTGGGAGDDEDTGEPAAGVARISALFGGGGGGGFLR